MQAVFAVIGSKGIGAVADFEFAIGNAVAIPANQGAEIRRFGQVAAKAVKTQHDAGLFTVLVGGNPGSDHAAVGGYLYLYAVFVGQRVELNGFAIGFAKRLFADTGGRRG